MEILTALAALLNIGAGDEKLADDVIIFREKLIINVHQLALADSGAGLLAWHILWPLGQVELPKAHGNGTGGDKNDLMSGVLQIAQSLAQPLHPLNI